MWRRYTHQAWAAVGALLLAFPAAVPGQTAGPSTEPAAANSAAAEHLVIERLGTTIVDATYERVDFEDLIDDLRERYDLNIHVSWQSLQRAGLRRDHRVEIRLTQVTLSMLLEMVLREVGERGTELSYQVEGNVIVISTEEDLGRNAVLRVYDITDLIESGYAIRRFANTPVLSLRVTGREFIGGEVREGGFGGGDGEGNIFGEAGDDPELISTMERIQMVIDLIQEYVQPESWLDNGGEVGSIRDVNSSLLIRHTLNGHARIADLLDLVRSTLPRPLDADVVELRMRADKASLWRDGLGDRFPRVPGHYMNFLMTSPDAEGLLFRAASSGCNGQRVWFSALTQRDILTGARPVVSEHVSAFTPVSGFATEGFELIALPLLEPDGESLVLDVEMAWIPPRSVSARSVRLTAGEGGASVDQVVSRMRTVSTTVQCRLGEGVALSIPRQIEQVGQPDWEDWLIVRIREPGTP